MPPFRSSKFIRTTQFGFDNAHRHKAIHQFRELLKLNKARFQDMKEKFKKITQKHLDIDTIGSEQCQALDKALEDVQSQLPDLFNKGNLEQRLFFAMRAILVIHNYNRKKRTCRTNSNKKNQKTDAKPSLAERMAANLATITNGPRAPRIFASPAPALRKVQSCSSGTVKVRSPLSEIRASASSRSLSAHQQSSPALPHTPNPNSNVKTPSSSRPGLNSSQVSPPSLARCDSSHIDESKAIKVENPSFSTPSTSSSNMMASSTSCGDAQVCGGQTHSVHKFLEAAIPSMTHLLHRFIEFGCLSEDFLLAISMWSPESIRTFLKSLPPGPGGSVLTKMEVDILTYHFESYFLASNSKA